MKILVATANLGNFDTPVNPVAQTVDHDFVRFTDDNFPPIAQWDPRLQYRIPKLFSWQMMPDYDYYLWLDGSMSLPRPDSLQWFLDRCQGNDIVLFKHPWRHTMTEEVLHIDDHLKRGKPYISARYKNGLHWEQLAECLDDPDFTDTTLYTSTVFMYRNNPKTQQALKDWWYHQSRYYTCDQVVLPYIVFKNRLEVSEVEDNQYEFEHLKLVSSHK